jgi:signal transduction histidine kinase
VAGGIALTAFAPHTAPASAALTGIFAGSFAIGLRRILSAVEIDDPGDLIAMFLSGGLISGLLAPVLWLGGGQGLLNQLVMQLTGIIAISAWSFGVTFLVAQLLFRFAGLRVSEGDEARGLSRVHFDMQSEPDFFLTQFMDNAHTQSGHEQAGKGQLSRLAIIFSQSIVDLRTETHRATERILSMSPDAKHGVAMAARIRLAENTLRVKSEDILLLLGGALDCDKMAVNGAGFLRWAKNVLEILMEPALRDLEQFTRHLPLQAELEELENIILAAADTVERCAHQVDLLGDLSDSQKQGFFSRDHKCDLAALLQEQSTLLQTLADIHNSPIQIDSPVDAGLIVAGDANAFKRILTLSAEGALNRLLSKDGKPVRIELREHTSGRHIVFECLDTGSALTARQIRAIIDPTTENHALEELGLPQILPLMLVARLVDAIGGELSLSSEHGLGTMLQCRFRMLHSI